MCTPSRGPLQLLILDEIALEGLEGITIPSLWAYIASALELPLPLTNELQEQIWNFIKRSEKHFDFYVLPEKRETVVLFKRFSNLDGEYGVPITQPKCPYPRYKFKPIQSADIIGSCECYKERKKISFDILKTLSVNDVLERWSQKFVIVGNQELRWNALTPPNKIRPIDLTSLQYSLLEAIGRARYNGESTAGKWSLQQLCVDSSALCYIKHKLIRCGLIAAQAYNEKQNDRLANSSLLTLPRFYATHKSLVMQIMEQIFSIIKNTPENRISAVEARNLISPELVKSFKKISSTQQFRQIFETQTIPYITKLNPKEKERNLVVISLRNPNLSVDELFPNDFDDDNDDNNEEFWSYKNSYVNMPIREECYRAILRHGSRGCTHSELCEYMAIAHLTMRQIVKTFLDDGLVRIYTKDMGRQRAKMYVAIEHREDVDKYKENVDVAKNLRCADEPNLPKTSDGHMNDIEEVEGSIKFYDYDVSLLTKEIPTERLMKRKTMIVDTINERCYLPISDMRSTIQSEEKKLGYKDEVCQKSVRRLLCYMHQKNIIQLYEINVNYSGLSRSYRYVTHPKIDINHPVLKHEMLKLKNTMYLIKEEKREQEKAKQAIRSKLAIGIPTVAPIAGSSKTTDGTTASQPIPKVMSDTSQKLLKLPKFLVSRYMHELIFYLVFELKSDQEGSEITEEHLQYWQQTEPDLHIREYLEECQSETNKIMVFSRDINWRTFIPPMPNYENKPHGWIYFLDVIDRVPLSIFNKIFLLEKGANADLLNFIAHPVRQHYLVSQLPKNLRGLAVSRIEMQKTYLTILKLLNNMGLLQVAERAPVRDPLVLWIFVNKRTKTLETTTTEAGYNRINPAREYPTLKYEFRSFADVLSYWSNLQRICFYTKLGFKKGSVELVKRPKELQFLEAVAYNQAPECDDGTVPGDCAGAGGLSSLLFAHIFRNWSWVVQTSTKPVKPPRLGRIPAIRSKPKLRLQGRRSRIHMPPIHVKRFKNITNTNTQTNSGTKSTNTKSNKSKETTTKKYGPRDAIDRDALNNMRTLRVQWTREEDDMLKISRTVYLYIAAPVVALGMLSVGKIVRDILRHTLNVKNKTSQACARRCQFLVKMHRDVPEVPSWLHILQTHEHMQQRYGDNFLKRLKQEYTNRKDYCDALIIHFIKIMQFVYASIYNKSTVTSNIKPTFLIPDTVDEFEKQFRERIPSTDEPIILHKNPITEHEQHVALVLSVLHCTLCCARDKTLYNLQAFEIYKNYSENVLHDAFTKARNDSLAVLIKRKNLQLTPIQLAGPAYLLSSKYRMRLTFLKIPYHVYKFFYAYFCEITKIFFAPHSSKDTKKYFELKSPQVGQLIVIAEGIMHGYWQINIKFPINILTIDAEQRENASHMDRILDHYSSIFENAPTTEYDKQIAIETNERQTLVKFHPAHLTYKTQYSPYDIISKISERNLHFFCALDCLNQEIEINLKKLLQKVEDTGNVELVCPFNCILKHSNYLDAIERIVNENKSMLYDLNNAPTQKHFSLTAENTRIKIQSDNVLTVVRMLESYWRNNQSDVERKDLGKIATAIKVTKPIDWLQICVSILETNPLDEDNDKADEYEPTLHREERAMRAQDVFVVNLPTLQFSATAKLFECQETVQFQGFDVPASLVETEVKREAILENLLDDSYWKYTENTLETLEPELVALHLSAVEKKFIADVHNYIELYKFGVTVIELMDKFPNHQLLLRALHVLGQHYLVKRVGIATVMYVHKNHIRPWVIHTFHIKRLEQEKMGSAKTVALKRKSKFEDEDDTGTNSKKIKFEDGTASNTGKRKRRAPARFEPDKDETKKEISNSEVTRDTIVMKPRPWLRLNGSLNRRVFDRWLGSVLNECIARNGCNILEICQHFPHMAPVDIMFLLEILNDLKCINLIQIESAEVDIFSDYQNIKEAAVTELYNPADTYIKACADALSRIAIFIGQKKYNAEFI